MEIIIYDQEDQTPFHILLVFLLIPTVGALFFILFMSASTYLCPGRYPFHLID